MWGETNQNDGQNRSQVSLHYYINSELGSRVGRWIPPQKWISSHTVLLDTEPKQMPPKTMLLFISQCSYLHQCFRFLSGLNFIVVRDLYNFRWYLQVSHSLINKCEQNIIQSEKPLIHD